MADLVVAEAAVDRPVVLHHHVRYPYFQVNGRMAAQALTSWSGRATGSGSLTPAVTPPSASPSAGNRMTATGPAHQTPPRARLKTESPQTVAALRGLGVDAAPKPVKEAVEA